MVKVIKKIIERIRIRRLNKLGEQLTLLLNDNAGSITAWVARNLAAEGWRLIHTSEMDELLETIDRIEKQTEMAFNADAGQSDVADKKADSQVAQILGEYFYGSRGDE